MLFHTTLTIIPGKVDDFLYIIKTLGVPEEIKIREFVRAFGKNDFFIFFEAPSESAAMEFVLKFTSGAEPETSLCTPVEISK